MTEKEKLLILQTAKGSGKVKELVKEGLLYFQIANFIEELFVEGLLQKTHTKITITEQGSTALAELRKKLQKNEWIGEEKRSKIFQIGKNDVYLPDQDEVKFLFNIK
jgi:predicted transcriptional regulator